MADFLFVAINRKGFQISGEIEAFDQKTALRKLHADDLTVIRLDPVRPKPWIYKVLQPVRPILLVLFFRQLAVMIASGIPVMRTVESLASGETQGPVRYRKALRKLAVDVHSGYSLSQAMRQQPEYFSAFMSGSVRIGEVSGRLPETLINCATHLEKEYRYGLRLKQALVYPIALLTCSGLLMFFCFTYMIPKFLMLFGDMQVELPLPTRIVMQTSRWVEMYGPVVLATLSGPLVFGLWIFQSWARSRHGRWHLEWLLLKTPWYGGQVRRRMLAQYFRSLSTLLRSAVPIVATLEVLVNSLDREILSATARYQLAAVQEGTTLSAGMRRSGFFPPLAVEMVRVGEVTGDPTPMMERLADFFDEEMGRGLETMSKLIEPIILAVMGGAVAFLLLAAFMPIYTLAQSF